MQVVKTYLWNGVQLLAPVACRHVLPTPGSLHVTQRCVRHITCSHVRWARGTRLGIRKTVPTAEPVEVGSTENTRDLLQNSVSGSIRPDREEPVVLWKEGPYPKDSNYKQSQARHSYRPNIEPEDTSIILFPGQGTQYVGMGQDLLEVPNVKEMYDVASNILGYDLLELSLNGPASHLSQTAHQQPAILVASLAAVERLRHDCPEILESCVATAGFSVGEITALTFAGAFSFEEAVQLIKVRAEAMQLASQLTPSGMMTVFYRPDSRLGFACSVAKEFCVRRGIMHADCRIASYLYPHCKVIAGNDEALEFIEKHKDDFNLKKLKRLKVSGAFHTDLMLPAVEAVQKALKHMEISDPLIAVHSNIDGRAYRSSHHIRKLLPKHICKPVKWEQTLHTLYERHVGMTFPKTYECGPGTSLKTILKMVNEKASHNCTSVTA